MKLPLKLPLPVTRYSIGITLPKTGPLTLTGIIMHLDEGLSYFQRYWVDLTA